MENFVATVSSAAAALLLPIFLLLLFAAAGKKRAAQILLPPSPPRLPLIGNLHQLGPLLHHSLTALAGVHGPIMLVYFGSVPTFVISSADLARKALRVHDPIFASRPFIRAASVIHYGNKDVGFAPYGAYWRWTRKIVSLHLLSTKRVQSLNPQREEEVVRMVEAIKADQSLNGIVDLSKILYAFTNNVICRMVSRNLARDLRRNQAFRELTDELVAVVTQANMEEAVPWAAWLGMILGLTKTARRAEENHRKWDALLEEVIKEHKRKEEDNSGGGLEKGFVEVLLSLKENGVEGDEGLVLDDNNIKALLVDVFTAGTGTTYATLEWAMAEMAKKPEVMKRVQDEVSREAKKFHDDKRILSMEQVSSMSLSYLNAVIKETLRLHPVAPLLLPKETIEDCVLNGYKIPKGARVMINAWAIARDPKYWEAPEDFVPDRFMGSSIDFKGNDFQFIPFGSGRRICPGLLLASSTLELALANLMYCFDWEPPGGTDRNAINMDELFGITVQRKEKLELVAKCLI